MRSDVTINEIFDITIYDNGIVELTIYNEEIDIYAETWFDLNNKKHREQAQNLIDHLQFQLERVAEKK